MSAPTYDSVVKKLEGLLGSNPTPAEIDKAVSQLSDAEKAVFYKDFDPSTLTAQEKADIAKGFQHYLATDEAKRRMAISAEDATNAAVRVTTAFQSLIGSLAQVDGQNLTTDKFAPEAQKVYATFVGVLAKSTAFATGTAQYARHWEGFILPGIMDEKVPVAVKLAILDVHVRSANAMQTGAEDLQSQFLGVGSDLAKLTGKLKAFGDTQEKANLAQIDALNAEIKQLDDDLETLRKQLLATAVAGSILTVACGLMGPFGILGTLIGGGLTIGLCLKFAADIKRKESERQNKYDQAKALQEQNELIGKTRGELSILGDKTLREYTDASSAILSVFRFAAQDAVKIQTALMGLGPNVQFIQYDAIKSLLLTEIGYIGGIYETMATYLEKYADGVTDKQLKADGVEIHLRHIRHHHAHHTG